MAVLPTVKWRHPHKGLGRIENLTDYQRRMTTAAGAAFYAGLRKQGYVPEFNNMDAAAADVLRQKREDEADLERQGRKGHIANTDGQRRQEFLSPKIELGGTVAAALRGSLAEAAAIKNTTPSAPAPLVPPEGEGDAVQEPAGAPPSSAGSATDDADAAAKKAAEDAEFERLLKEEEAANRAEKRAEIDKLLALPFFTARSQVEKLTGKAPGTKAEAEALLNDHYFPKS